MSVLSALDRLITHCCYPPVAIDWNLGRFVEGIDKYGYAIERDPRLMDDKYLEVGDA